MGGGPYQVMHRHTAERILSRHPEIANDNLYTRIVCGDLEGVDHILAEHPEAASEKGGPKGWPPLLYLCTGRLSLAAVRENSAAIARLLLDQGADPNAYYPGGNDDIHYTALTCVIGEGEENAPPHPQRNALARLLLERGAEPYDGQVLYNTHFHGEILWWLELMYEHAVRRGRKADWDDPHWTMLSLYGAASLGDGELKVYGARFLLGIAVRRNDLRLAAWILTHGGSPNAPPPVHPKLPKRTLLEEARRNDSTAMADLLARHGATGQALEGEDAFVAACLRLDRDAARAQLAAHPEYLQSPAAIHAAARQDRADVVSFMLDLGVSPDIADPKEGNRRPLHVAAYAGSARAAALLVERGAAIDPKDTNHDGTPLWWAVWGRRRATIEALSRVSRDLWALMLTGNVDRVREVLRAEPDLAKLTGKTTPLMYLPDDDARAIELIDLLLAHGADPTFRRTDGKTAADIARERGMEEAAARL